MKSLTATLFFVGCIFFGIGQNLVPNPGFEEHTACPEFLGQIDASLGWMNFGNTPDYFNSCSTATGLSIPNTSAGYQYAHSNDAMSGIVTYVWEQSPGWPHYREFMGVELLQPLIVGQKYFMSFFINHSGYLANWQKIGANKIGMRFFTVPFSESSPPALDNFAHLSTDSIYIDTVQWYKISGSFISDSAYEYLVIGNFFDEINTDTVLFGGTPFGGSSAYYFIDDICVSTDSIYTNTWTTLSNDVLLENNISIYPNPIMDVLNIRSPFYIESIQLINKAGQMIYEKENIYNSEVHVILDFLANDIYYLKINTSKGILWKKILIT